MRFKDTSFEKDTKSDVLTSCPTVCTKRDVDLATKWVSVAETRSLESRYHGYMIGDGSKRGILNTIPEKTKQHIQPIKGEGWIYPRRSVDGVITNCYKECNKGEDTCTKISSQQSRC